MSCRNNLAFYQQECFNPRPPKRTLCRNHNSFLIYDKVWFQSTSSEEDVVSGISGVTIGDLSKSFNPRPPKRTLCLDKASRLMLYFMFQSTSSEEDVVSCKCWH